MQNHYLIIWNLKEFGSFEINEIRMRNTKLSTSEGNKFYGFELAYGLKRNQVFCVQLNTDQKIPKGRTQKNLKALN